MKMEMKQLIADAISETIAQAPRNVAEAMELLVEEIIQRDSMDPDEQHRFRSLIDW